MAYVIVCMVHGLKYYIQEHNHKIFVNGLLDNAKRYLNEEVAREEIPKLQERIKLEMIPMEVLPESKP